MFYTTQVDEQTKILIEAPPAGGISKSDLEIRPDPERAFLNALDVIAKVAQSAATTVGNALDGTGMDFEITFGVRADGNGTVMLAQTPQEGQLLVKVSYKGS